MWSYWPNITLVATLCREMFEVCHCRYAKSICGSSQDSLQNNSHSSIRSKLEPDVIESPSIHSILRGNADSNHITGLNDALKMPGKWLKTAQKKLVHSNNV
jgi:hypothetical protein